MNIQEQPSRPITSSQSSVAFSLVASKARCEDVSSSSAELQEHSTNSQNRLKVPNRSYHHHAKESASASEEPHDKAGNSVNCGLGKLSRPDKRGHSTKRLLIMRPPANR